MAFIGTLIKVEHKWLLLATEQHPILYQVSLVPNTVILLKNCFFSSQKSHCRFLTFSAVSRMCDFRPNTFLLKTHTSKFCTASQCRLCPSMQFVWGLLFCCCLTLNKEINQWMPEDTQHMFRVCDTGGHKSKDGNIC